MLRRIALGMLVPVMAMAAPMEFTHSGRLLTAAGEPVNDPSVGLTFRLWTASSAGTQLWEEVHPAVAVQDSYFQVDLGSITPLQSAWFTDGRAGYLQILLNDEAIGPRMALAGVPYAAHAASAGAIPPVAGPLVCDSAHAGALWHQESGAEASIRVCRLSGGAYQWADAFGGAPTPSISNIDVLTGTPGQTVTVTGSGFAVGATTVTLGGNPLAIDTLTTNGFSYEAPFTPTGSARTLVVTNTETGDSTSYTNAWTNTVPLPTGGTVTTLTSGGQTYRLHAFSNAGSAVFETQQDLVADILIVGGGGSGGISHGNQDTGKGGGGAGGVVFGSGRPVPANAYNITVGGGGAGATQGNNANGAQGNDGNPSSGFGVTALGGGGGGKSDGGSLGRGRNGASGGGGAARSTTFTGGSALQSSPAGWTGYGNNGGNSYGNANYGGGGGGGAGGVGAPCTDPNANQSRGGDGGPGVDMSSVFGVTYGEGGWFGGGGGGGTRSNNSVDGQPAGGIGGGGDGNCGSEGNNVQCVNINAMPGTGGGGGGSSESPNPGQYCSDAAGFGGSGIVLIRYPYQP